MTFICLLLCFLSATDARIVPRIGANDVFDGVEGVIYDIPEYEDPEMSLFKLIARGILPVYTTRGGIKDSKELLNKDDKPQYQTDDIKKGLDTVVVQLQEAKNKLENGNNAIYLDIDKSVLLLENLKHHLYLDLHTTEDSAKQITMPDMPIPITKGKSHMKVSTYVYPVLRATMKKSPSSADSAYKYYSLDIPTEQPSSSEDKPTDSFFDLDTALVPYPGPNTPIEPSSANDNSNEQSVYFNPPQDMNLTPDTKQILTFVATTEQSSGFDKDAFKYHFLGTDAPSIEATPGDKNVKPYEVGDVKSSAEAQKDEQPDKTIIRKKWTMKLSSTI